MSVGICICFNVLCTYFVLLYISIGVHDKILMILVIKYIAIKVFTYMCIVYLYTDLINSFISYSVLGYCYLCTYATEELLIICTYSNIIDQCVWVIISGRVDKTKYLTNICRVMQMHYNSLYYLNKNMFHLLNRWKVNFIYVRLVTINIS